MSTDREDPLRYARRLHDEGLAELSAATFALELGDREEYRARIHAAMSLLGAASWGSHDLRAGREFVVKTYKLAMPEDEEPTAKHRIPEDP